MSIQLVTGFLVNAAESLDNRIVASGSTERDAIPYKYEGMRVFDLSNERSYFWTNGSFQPEITDQVNGTASYVPKFTSQYYIGNSYIYDAGSKIGIGTNNPTGDYTYVQIGGMNLSEDPQYYPGQGMPFVIHKGGNTVLGHNWYYSGVNNFAFDLNLTSTWITIDPAGCLSIRTRKGGGPFSNTNNRQSIYISEDGRLGIGIGWKLTNSPTEVLDVDGNARVSGTVFTSYAQISNSASINQSYGLVLHDNTSLALPGPTPIVGQGLFIDWSSNTLLPPTSSVRSYWGGIGGYSRGTSGGDLIFYTSPSYIVNPGDATRPKRLIIKNTGEIAIGEDPNLPVANGPQTINGAIANLFSTSTPKFEVITGASTGTYKDLMVLRHPATDATAVLRRIGYIAKLSTEGSSFESNKSGGFIVESTSANAANPSLHLILGTNKHLSITSNDTTVYAGVTEKIKLTDINFFAGVHNVTNGGTSSYLEPSIASGEYTPTSLTTTNCSVSNIRPANWMRVGNVVSVSGQLSVDPIVAGFTTFELSLPVPANFYINISSNNSWRLSGVGVILANQTSNTSIPVRIAGSGAASSPTNRVKFSFFAIGTELGVMTVFYNYQYNQDLSNVPLTPVENILTGPSM